MWRAGRWPLARAFRGSVTNASVRYKLIGHETRLDAALVGPGLGDAAARGPARGARKAHLKSSIRTNGERLRCRSGAHLVATACTLYVMIRTNSSRLTSPSPSTSARLIISRSSSSVMFSPSSRATRFRLWNVILPVSSSSNSLKTRLSSSGESRSPILPVIISTNSLKSMVPEPSRSMSAIIFRTLSFFESKPSARSATCSSLVSIMPEPSVSNKSKASRSSCICHSGSAFCFSSFSSLAIMARPRCSVEGGRAQPI
mmetsp:Transcript_25982/g.86599  ORF Transcript_25982/g.86599 Transcript_25982/m.86599 type:complete len:258 (+) Transcript_25982:131-904(+)